MNTTLTDEVATDLTPLGKRILVRRIEDAHPSLIVIPDSAKENSKIAEIMAVGPKAYGLKRGDIVLLPGIASKYPDWEQCHMMMVTVDDVGGIFIPTDIASA